MPMTREEQLAEHRRSEKAGDARYMDAERERLGNKLDALRRREAAANNDDERRELLDQIEDVTADLDKVLARIGEEMPARMVPHRQPGEGAADERLGGDRRKADLEADYERRGWRRRRPVREADLDNLDDGGFRDGADFLRAIRDTKAGKYDKRLEPWDLRNSERRAQSVGTGEDGGYLAPPAFNANVSMRRDLLAPHLAMRTEFDFRRGEGGSTSWPVLKDGDKSTGEIGAFALARYGEGNTLDDDTIKFQNRLFRAKKAARLATMPNELLYDSAVDMAGMVAKVIARAVAFMQAYDTINGVGSNEPLGWANGKDKYEVSTSTGAGNLLVSDLSGMVSRLENGGGEATAWIMHQSVFPALASLRFSTTAGEAPIFMPNAAGAGPRTLYGFPIFFSDACKTLNTAGDIWLANLDEYVYGSTDVVIDVSTDVDFKTDSTVFRVRLRDDGMPMRSGTLTDRQSYESSNFVSLATRS